MGKKGSLKTAWCRILENVSRQAWSLSFCHNRLGSQSPHALLDQIQDTERVPVPIGVSFFKKVLLPRIAWCSKLRTLFWGRSLAPFCVPFECSVIVSAFCVWRRQESPCSSLVRHRAAWNHQRTPFQQRLGAQMGTVFAACVADFFQTWRAKLWIFRACSWVRFSCPF